MEKHYTVWPDNRPGRSVRDPQPPARLLVWLGAAMAGLGLLQTLGALERGSTVRVVIGVAQALLGVAFSLTLLRTRRRMLREDDAAQRAYDAQVEATSSDTGPENPSAPPD